MKSSGGTQNLGVLFYLFVMGLLVLSFCSGVYNALLAIYGNIGV